ncbi:hypothetical protein F2Q69_00049435 [Brassica cretica]|uniref:Arabidopsis retrotransposon Orf1 C-terminal domain-containing protein n=1 Tax=Brassica cretica TaxID=69181 RepID=A0A8S9PNR3_BRACR|nr:hypothetical protein F2Q69_00049435 [Brassica cretica]
MIRATGPSRSHIRCPELESRSGSDVSQRPREVARVFCRWERLDQSDSAKSLAFSATRSDLSERPLQVAPEPVQVTFAPTVYSSPPIPISFHPKQGTMVRKTKGKSDAERQEPESQESSLRGKAIASERAGSGTQRTSRQKTLAAKKAKEQEKRAGKSIAVATDEESGDESADEQAPTKRAKMSKGKEIAEDRDRAKTPSEEELYHHLLNWVTWIPTRFADLDLLKEVGLDSDIEAMLGHLKMPKLLTMAYPTYRDVSCQFLSSLEVTYHDDPHCLKSLRIGSAIIYTTTFVLGALKTPNIRSYARYTEEWSVCLVRGGCRGDEGLSIEGAPLPSIDGDARIGDARIWTEHVL